MKADAAPFPVSVIAGGPSASRGMDVELKKHRSLSWASASAGTSSKGLAFSRSEETKIMARYSKSASKDVKGAMERRKAGTLKSGKSGKTVKSKKQAIAIGLSEARSKGKKVPSKKTA
jgi:hypothetical protein